jgi:hypothetical protein
MDWDIIQDPFSEFSNLYIFDKKFDSYKEFIEEFQQIIWVTYRKNFSPILRRSSRYHEQEIFKKDSKTNDQVIKKKSKLLKTSSKILKKTQISDIIQSLKSDFNNAESSIRNSINSIRNDLSKNRTLTSDTGWGCMLRSSQMLLAETIRRILYDEILKESKTSKLFENSILNKRKEIITDFFDSEKYAFSFHQMVKIGSKYGKDPESWYGPTTSCYVLRDLVENSKLSLKIIVTEQGQIYKDSLDFNLKNLILVPLRLGLRGIPIKYHKELISFLNNPNSVGIMGGTPNHSLYFIGSYSDKTEKKSDDFDSLLYLDPHTTQLSTISDIGSYSCSNPMIISISDIDTSLAVGFLIRDMEDFIKFKDSMKNSILINFQDETPSFDFDWNSEII